MIVVTVSMRNFFVVIFVYIGEYWVERLDK